MSAVDEGYSVVANTLRDPKTGRVLSSSFWVCGPAGFLRGPLSRQDAQALAQRLNNGDQSLLKKKPWF